MKEEYEATTQVNEDTASHEATTAQEQTTDATPVPSAQGKRTLILAISIIVALLAAGGVYAGVTVHENHARESAYSQAQKVDKQLVKSVNTASQLAKLDKSKVADAKVLTELQRALDDAKANLGVSQQDANQALLWQVLGAKQAYAQDKDTASQLRDKLDKAVKKVKDSVSAKQLADAKQALTDRVHAAKQSLTDSDGKVQDNATRDQLQQAIDTASKLLTDKKATLKALQDAPAKLDTAINTVNQSVEAKRKADEAAARQAAEEEAARQATAAQAQQSTSTPRNYSYSGGGYSGGGYTAPRNSGGGNYSAPQQQSSGGGFGGFIGGGEGVKPGDPSYGQPVSPYIYH